MWTSCEGETYTVLLLQLSPALRDRDRPGPGLVGQGRLLGRPRSRPTCPLVCPGRLVVLVGVGDVVVVVVVLVGLDHA